MTAAPKDVFPRFLTKALQNSDSVQAKPNAPFNNEPSGIKRNMLSALKATGIYPFNREEELKRLPDKDAAKSPDAEINYLREQRFGGSASRLTSRRKRRLNVVPGASVSTKHNEDEPNNDTTDEENHQSESLRFRRNSLYQALLKL